jgi:hypothetical protein
VASAGRHLIWQPGVKQNGQKGIEPYRICVPSQEDGRPYLSMKGGPLAEHHAGELSGADRVSTIVCGARMGIARKGCQPAR